ncbi:hypothetical protein D9757_014593 [Collybiopsis confluens]|uniref:Uncharacterized protein n=2 Tax=Collybiopsis confluens TaxID=2823264 RepID=A0A8H5G049_9AGAR|nr:hypothetical protein D9757_014593 [Collybiopsis confluens]
MIKFGSVRGNFFQHFFSLVSSLAFSAMPKSSIKTVSKRGTKRQPKSAWKSSSKKRKIDNSQPSSDKSKRKTKSKDEEEQEQSEEDSAHAESDNDNDNDNDPARKYQKIIELARFVPMMLHPQPSFYEIFQMGLENAGLLEIPLCDLPSRDEERNQLRKFYNFFKNQLGNWFEDVLLEAVNEECVSDLISHMNTQVTDGISQDVRHLKDLILEYIEDTIDLPLVPLIKPGKKKAETRGFYHLQIARLLVPVTMLQTFDKDPKKFCQNYQERELEDGQISSTHLPAFFYDDLGDAASLDFRELFTGLLQGRLIVLTLVHIYLGADNAQKFRAYFMALRLGGSDCKKFRVKKTGKAYQKKIMRVTFSMIAELVLQVRHSLSSCDDRRCEEGSVVKLDAYDAVMALANNPEYFNEDFLKNVEEFYAEIVGWMLPEEEKPRLQNDEDPHCGLSLISKLLALQKQAAEEERAEAEAAPGTDKGEDSSEDGSIEMVASSRCGSPPPPSSDAEAVDLFNDDEVPETEDETDPPPKNSSASSSHPSSSSKSSRSFSALGSSNVFAYKNASTSKPSSSSLRVAVPEKRAKLSQVEKDPLAESQRSIIPTKKGKAKITVANPIKQMITPPKKPFVPPIRLVKYA